MVLSVALNATLSMASRQPPAVGAAAVVAAAAIVVVEVVAVIPIDPALGQEEQMVEEVGKTVLAKSSRLCEKSRMYA